MFSIDYKINVSDINYGGHMGNERSLIVFQQTRIDWFASMGYSEINIGDDIGIIQSESNVKYLKEVFLGENLKSYIKDVTFSRSSFNIFYEVLNEKNEIVLIGSTLLLAYNYQKKKVVSIPKDFLEKIKSDKEII